MDNQDSTAESKFNNSSSLHSLLSNAHLLHQIGYDKEKRTPKYIGNKEELSRLYSDADCTITTISLGIAAIGKLMSGRDKTLNCFNDEDIDSMGWLLNDLGSAVIALQNIQTITGDAISEANHE